MAVAAWTASALHSIITLRRSARTQRNFDFKMQLEIAELYLHYLYSCYQHWSMYYGRYHKNCRAYGCAISFKKDCVNLEHMIIHDKCNRLPMLKEGSFALCELIVSSYITHYPSGDSPLQSDAKGVYPIFSPVRPSTVNHRSHNNFHCRHHNNGCTLRTLCEDCQQYINNLFEYKDMWLPPFNSACGCTLNAMSWQCNFCPAFLNDLLKKSGCGAENCTLNQLCKHCMLRFNLYLTGLS